MRWKKQGLIFTAENNFPWMVSDAAIPFAVHLYDDIFRIYFGCRDQDNCSSIAALEIDISTPNKIINLHSKPILSKGELGTFDDSGVWPSWIVRKDESLYLYYIGWNLGVTVPFRNFIGLAISSDSGLTFKRYSRAPISDRNDVDPFFFTGPCVLIENNIWRMWYLSCTKWSIEDDVPKHFYHIKYAESTDGLRWKREGLVCIDFVYRNEFAIARPSVIKERDSYKMWYSYRGGPIASAYRIGYAESTDGINWKRLDEEIDIDVSPFGWDSEMIEYAHVFDHKGKRYMLYNGNGFGKTGFGLAILDN